MGQERAEALDDDKLADAIPADAPYGVEEYGTTPAEQHVDEPLAERVAREIPEDAVVDEGPGPDEPLADIDDSATEHEGAVAAEIAAMHGVSDADL